MRLIHVQGTNHATKANFFLLAKEHCNWNRPPLLFLYVFQSRIIFQNFLPTIAHLHYAVPLTTQNLENLPLLKSTTENYNKICLVIISQLRCFLTFAGQSFNILIVLRASGLKATSSEA